MALARPADGGAGRAPQVWLIGESQLRIYRFAFERQDAEDALVDAPQEGFTKPL
jgi:hypothetical protein